MRGAAMLRVFVVVFLVVWIAIMISFRALPGVTGIATSMAA